MDLGTRRILVGLMVTGVGLFFMVPAAERAVFWDVGTVTVSSCRSYKPLTLRKRPSDVSDITGQLKLADGKLVGFNGTGLPLATCPPAGGTFEVNYDPAEPSSAQPREQPMAFVVGLGMIAIGLVIVVVSGKKAAVDAAGPAAPKKAE